MAPRRRPRGYIEPLPSGSFRAVVFTGIDPLTRKRQYMRETCRTRAEAEKALTRLQGQVDERRLPKSSITVATAVEQWMEVADLEVTTRERYEDLIRLYILPTFGDLQAGRLDAELLERFYARLHRCKSMCGGRPPRGHACKPLSTSTTRKIHYVLRGALGRAARWGYVSVNVAELAQAPSPRKPRPDPPSAREAADLLNDAWTDPEWGLLLWLTMITGLRRGELCALRWRHVDLDRANLWVERSTAHSRTGLVDKDTKTENQRRLSLDPHTVDLLHTHRATVAAQLAALGVALDGDTYVFSTTPDYSQPRNPKGFRADAGGEGPQQVEGFLLDQQVGHRNLEGIGDAVQAEHGEDGGAAFGVEQLRVRDTGHPRHRGQSQSPRTAHGPDPHAELAQEGPLGVTDAHATGRSAGRGRRGRRLPQGGQHPAGGLLVQPRGREGRTGYGVHGVHEPERLSKDGENRAEDATLAARNALLNMIEHLTERGWSRQQGYTICSVAVDLKISALVDVPNILVSAFLPEDIFVG